ncbi:MAG TPA: hypothetical protein VFK05_17300 [Polyangiaceae bacterium]|nr:hypothetical protein [Polyangiaceae bacterium]
MDSIDLAQLERRARRKYEWARVRRALLGFTPALLVIAFAALVNKHHVSACVFGSALFVAGAALLWYGHDIRRAVLPGLAMGLLPLSFALCVNHIGHACMGDHCLTLCVPACALGGIGAGVGVSIIGMRWKQGWPFWAGATVLTLLTGAMGCSCVGYGGIAGLALGFSLGLLPVALRRLRRPE